MNANTMQNALRVLNVIRRAIKALEPCVLAAKHFGHYSLPCQNILFIRKHLARSLGLDSERLYYQPRVSDSMASFKLGLIRAIRRASTDATECASVDARHRAAYTRFLAAAARVWAVNASEEDLETIRQWSLLPALYAAPARVKRALKRRAAADAAAYEADLAAYEQRDRIRRAITSALPHLSLLRNTREAIEALDSLIPAPEDPPRPPRTLKTLLEVEFCRRRDARAAQLADEAAKVRRQAAARSRKLAAFKALAALWVAAKRENRQAIARRLTQGLPPPRPIPGFRLLQTVKNQLKAPAKKGQKKTRAAWARLEKRGIVQADFLAAFEILKRAADAPKCDLPPGTRFVEVKGDEGLNLFTSRHFSPQGRVSCMRSRPEHERAVKEALKVGALRLFALENTGSNEIVARCYGLPASAYDVANRTKLLRGWILGRGYGTNEKTRAAVLAFAQDALKRESAYLGRNVKRDCHGLQLSRPKSLSDVRLDYADKRELESYCAERGARITIGWIDELVG